MDCFHKKVMGLQTIFANQVKTIFNDQSVFDEWESSLGSGRTGYCEGTLMEKAGFNVSFIQGNALPPAATAFRDELACQPYKAVGLSAILHPYNPKIPTAHMNIRRFEVLRSSGEPIIWFGGGFDLTPYFPIKKQVINWHVKTKEFLDKYDKRLYSCWKKDCDDYFYLKHRQESRGVGGIFFDDFLMTDLNQTTELVLGVAELFIDLYFDICSSNKSLFFTSAEKDFQLWRRGRYVEFNLLQDRGTLFGLQSRGRTESILISLPPTTKWIYKGEERFEHFNRLLQHYLKPKDWIKMQESAFN